MAVVVIDEAEGEVVIFRRETEGVFGEDVAVGNAGGAGSAGDGAEGGIVVVGGDAVLRGVVEEFGNILVAVVGVEEIEIPILGTHDKRPRGDLTGARLVVLHAAAHAVEGHGHHFVPLCPADGVIPGIVFHRLINLSFP